MEIMEQEYVGDRKRRDCLMKYKKSVQSCSIRLAVTILFGLIIFLLFDVLTTRKNPQTTRHFLVKYLLLLVLLLLLNFPFLVFNFPVLSHADTCKEFTSQQLSPVANMENIPLYTFKKSELLF